MTGKLFYGKGVTDVNTPYRLMRKNVFVKIYNKFPKDTFAPNVIISGIVGLKKMRIFEIPVSHQHRRTGEVSIEHFKLLQMAIKSFIQTISYRISKKFIQSKNV